MPAADTTSYHLASLTKIGLAGFDRTVFERNLAQGYTTDGRTPQPYPSYFGTAAGLIASAPDVASYSMAIDLNAFSAP